MSEHVVGMLTAVGDVFTLFEDDKPPAKRDAPNIEGKPIFQSDNAIKCSTNTELKCLLHGDLEKANPDLKNNPETGAPYDEDGPYDDEAKARLLKRMGSREPYTVTTDTGSFTLRSATYPAGANGDNLLVANPNAGHYGGENPADCEVSDILLYLSGLSLTMVA